MAPAKTAPRRREHCVPRAGSVFECGAYSTPGEANTVDVSLRTVPRGPPLQWKPVEIPAEQGFSPQHRDRPAEREEWAERNGFLAAFPAQDQEAERDAAPREHAQHQREKSELPAE